MTEGFLWGRPPQRVLRRLLQIVQRPRIVPPTLKVDRQGCGVLSGLRPITALFPLANGAMELDAPPRRQAVIQHLLVEGMAELVAPRHRPVRPFLYPAGLQDVAASRQAITALL